MACCGSCAETRTDPGSSVKGLCVPVKNMYSTAAQEKSQMQDLNNVLASYIDKVRVMRAQAGAGIDPKAYKEAMKTLENEMMTLKNMYERELAKLRQMVEDANRDKSSLVANLNSYSNKASTLQGRLDAEASGNQRVLQDNANLTRILSEKEKEIAQLKGCLGNCQSELNLVKPQLAKALQELETLRKRLEAEQSARIAAEDKLKSLCDKVNFDANACNQTNRDLQERVKALNDIIASLECKIEQLSRASGDNTAGLLQKLRDGTNAELRRYKQEADDVLNKAIRAMHKQREEDMKSKDGLTQDRARLEALVNQLQGRIADLEGQLASCCSQKCALESALNCEKERARNHIKALEKKIADMNEQVLAKAKDITNAREAQVTLQTEINTYKTLLDEDQGFPTMNQSGGTPSPRPTVAPRPRIYYNSSKPAQNTTYKECFQTTSNIKPRINLTEYTDRYVNPNKQEMGRFNSGFPNVCHSGPTVAVYNSRPNTSCSNMYASGVPADLRLLGRSKTGFYGM